MDDKTNPSQSANKSKAEGDRWGSKPDTVEQQDRDRQGSRDQTPGYTSGTNAGGITNRPLEEEDENQAAVPDRDESREGMSAGRSDKDKERSDR
jgi:hypothetical protein